MTENEVRFNTIGNGNACPGADGISVELLVAFWDAIGTQVTIFFRACLHLGCHPKCFKLAEMIFFSKDGRDPNLVKGGDRFLFSHFLARV